MTKITADIMALCKVPLEDTKKFIRWVWNLRKINMFDMSVIGYPRTCMLRASDGDGALLYMPLQPVLMYDSIAAKPGISPRQEALALSRIQQLVGSVAKDGGFGESYFMCRDDRVADIAAAHGFEELKNVRVLRQKHLPEVQRDAK